MLQGSLTHDYLDDADRADDLPFCAVVAEPAVLYDRHYAELSERAGRT